jgi:hypothetical protein
MRKETAMKSLLVVTAFSLAVVGCAPSVHRGSVAMKINDTEAHVCMDKGEASPGDKVAIYRNDCPRPLSSRYPTGGGCKKVHVGGGVVTRNLNEHYSEVRVNPGVQFEEGMFVEKESSGSL